ncbi:MAG: 2-hydroxyacyl-CoA dehydratase family protein, partial [Chloroflexota bacterium]
DMSQPTTGNQETRLQGLVNANGESNRTRYALEWKKRGGKVIGLLCPYVPEEVVHAAGMLPWRITGTWQEDVSLAAAYRPRNLDLYCTHVLQSFLAGELDFLDGVVISNYDDDRRRLADVLVHLNRLPLVHIMHLPHLDSELGYQAFARSIKKLISDLEQLGGVTISEESMRQAITLNNETRTLLSGLYSLRKRDVPPLSGSEVLGIVTAASVMPKEVFNRDLKSLLDFLVGRQAPLARFRPRLLVSSTALDNPAYLDLIEGLGSVVAMDDLDTGSRYFWSTVDEEQDPISALARRYISRPPCPRMFFWDKQVERVISWAREFNIDGVLHLPQMYDYPRWFGVPYFERKMKEAGIPIMTFLREYHFTNVGQMKTRVQAFIEATRERRQPSALNARGEQ